MAETSAGIVNGLKSVPLNPSLRASFSEIAPLSPVIKTILTFGASATRETEEISRALTSTATTKPRSCVRENAGDFFPRRATLPTPMPDHLHLVWLGLSSQSDQLNGMKFLRLHLNRLLAGEPLSALETPVLMLTARDGSADRVFGLDTGADDYVVKPFDLPELLARLRALIRRSANEARSRIKIGDILIDTAARSVSRRGEEVALTAREYALLEYLALHRGEVVTRTALYEHLFDENDSTLSNLLDVHVSNVRRKLGRDFIVTRRGHGHGIGL